MDYIGKLIIHYQNGPAEVTQISHEKVPPMPEKPTCMFHNSFYPKTKIYLEDTEISKEIQQKLQTLKQDYENIVTQHSSDVGLTHLE